MPDSSKKIKQCEIINATDGIVEIVLDKTDTLQVGVYNLYVVIESEVFKVTSNRPVIYYVQADDGGAINA